MSGPGPNGWGSMDHKSGSTTVIEDPTNRRRVRVETCVYYDLIYHHDPAQDDHRRWLCILVEHETGATFTARARLQDNAAILAQKAAGYIEPGAAR